MGLDKQGLAPFSMMVGAIVAITVLVIVIIWMVPSYSDIFQKTDDIKDNSGVTDENILEIKCEPLCRDAKEQIDEGKVDAPETEFCQEMDCKSDFSFKCILVNGEAINCESE